MFIRKIKDLFGYFVEEGRIIVSVNRDIFISASAGTGKTYRLVSHYVQIFEEAFRHGEKLDVHNVVAITFTRKASKEMKERVHLRINEKIENNEPGDWKNLRSRLIYAWISTIHSFCERILRESSIFLGIDPGFEILSGVRRVALEAQVVRTYFEQHLDELEPLFDLIGVDKTFELFKKALSGMRVNLRIISPYEEEPLKIGNDGEKILLATRTFHKHFKQLVEHYENEARRNNSLDFDDLLIKTRDLLHNFPQLREKYVRRFKYILIDEFQDTDWLQKTIIDYLHEEERNFLLFVGDAKQSIYRFRGADVTVFNRTKAEFEIKNAHLETLSVNRRSHPDLVEFQNRLFSKIMLQDRSGKYYKSIYDTEVSAIPYEQDSNDSRVRVLVSENSDDSQVVAQYIKNLLSEEITFRNKDGSYSTRKIKPGDIAILLRKFVNVSRYEDALEENGIPYYTVGSKAFYDRPEIAGPLAWLDVIVDPLDDAAFARFLLSPAFGATLEDLFELKSKEKHISDAILKTTDERFKPLRELFIKYSELKHVLSPSSVLQKFVDETEYLPKLASMKRGERAINNVKKMLEIAKELDRLGTSLRELSSNIKAFIDSSEETEATLETEESDSVKLLTVHKSKGLEFPVVIVADTFWKGKSDGSPYILTGEDGYIVSREQPKKESDTIESQLHLEEKEKNLEEEKRTLYVAFSRAREMLVVSLNGKKATSDRPWSQMLQGTLITGENQLCEDMEDLVEIVEPGEAVREEPESIEEKESFIIQWPDIEFIKSVDDRSYIKYISPSLLAEDFTIEISESEPGDILIRKPRELGTLTHSVLEAVGIRGRTGRVTTLESLLSGGIPASVDRIRFLEEDYEIVRKILYKLIDHPLIKEIETSDEAMSEVQFQKKFDRYVLLGIVDKLYRVNGNWRILDFKFAEFSQKSFPKYEFQMKFYLYILKELLAPECAKLLFLKDGEVREVRLNNVEEFEKELLEKIENLGGTNERGE